MSKRKTPQHQERATPVETPATMPGRNGGTLRRGGSNGGAGGRPLSAIRLLVRDSFAQLIPRLIEIAQSEDASTSDQLRAIDLLGKYGLGTTVTETTTDGHDVITRIVEVPAKLSSEDWISKAVQFRKNPSPNPRWGNGASNS